MITPEYKNTQDLKSCCHCGNAGSSPSQGTKDALKDINLTSKQVEMIQKDIVNNSTYDVKISKAAYSTMKSQQEMINKETDALKETMEKKSK